ncbi:response regulator [Ectothiorhodospiraceae bacterium BW-2]|nr:response regulator [Ectothiorhodospiraceae bacterium BW-2]
MHKKSVLLVEDEAPIRAMLRHALSREDFIVYEADSVHSARLALADHRPDLILLDWLLPGGESGIDFAVKLRRDESLGDIPVILLTARAAEEDKVRALESGADDYITKPFSPRELVARIHAVLRRATPGDKEGKVRAGRITLDKEAHLFWCDDEHEIHLGPTEYKMLELFILAPERAFSRSQLLDRIWGHGSYVEDRTVDVHVRRLRQALMPYQLQAYIKTVRGVGYRFSSKT